MKNNSIKISVISTLSDMMEIRNDWTTLFNSSIKPNVFGTWEWQYQSAQLLSRDKKLSIITIYSGKKLIAIFPTKIVRKRFVGLFTTDTIKCLGGAITDYNVLIVRNRYLSTAVKALGDYFQRNRLILDMENTLPGTALYIFCLYLQKCGFRPLAYETKTALGAILGSNYEDFHNGLKKKFRKNLRNNRNVMDRKKGYTYQTGSEDKELLDKLIRLHTARWRYKGEAGALALEKIRAFHFGLQEIAGKPFEIRYYTIQHSGCEIAILYGFILGNCYYVYLSGLDQRHNRISPGNMVIEYAIRELIRKKIRRFDMLRGDMSYKQSWATYSYKMRDTLLFPPTPLGRFLFIILKCIRSFKDLIPKQVKEGLKSWGRSLGN